VAEVDSPCPPIDLVLGVDLVLDFDLVHVLGVLLRHPFGYNIPLQQEGWRTHD